MFGVTGASGKLGGLVIEALLKMVEPQDIVALVRDPTTMSRHEASGVSVRAFDYDQPAQLAAALHGVERLLLISSNRAGSFVEHHNAVIKAAASTGVRFIAYTSILGADTSHMTLASDHRETERLLVESGLDHVLLRNGWYTENYVEAASAAIALGVLLGCAGDGRISGASREDFAAAAATVLASKHKHERIYELAGDDAFTLQEFAAALGEMSGKAIIYRNGDPDTYAGVLRSYGLPDDYAQAIAQSDLMAARGELFDDGHALRRLIGRPTTPWRRTLSHMVAALSDSV